MMMEGGPAQGQSKRWEPTATFKRLTISFAVVLILAITVTSINSVYSVSEQVRASSYDGVTLYRGLFFASGPLASKIPTLRKAAPYFPAEYKSLEAQITRYIREKDPTYFDRFAKEIQSGDRVRVADAIRGANKVQKEALLEVTKNSNTQFATQLRRLKVRVAADPEPEVIKDFVSCVILMVHIILEISDPVVNVATAKAQRELKGLTFERYVDEIVRAVPSTRVVKPVVSP